MDRPVARPLTDEEQAELSQLCEGALFLLPSPEDVGMSADDVDAGMLPKFVGVMAEAVRRGFELPITVSTDELAMRLGALYGDEICRLAGWEINGTRRKCLPCFFSAPGLPVLPPGLQPGHSVL